MKKILFLACALAITAGCAAGVKKHFSVVVDPPGADITVIPGGDRPEQKYRSPADITVSVPKDPALAVKSRMEIRREAYKPKIIVLSGISEGETLKIKLDKVVHYLLKFRLLGPVQSDDLHYRDKIVDIRIKPGERNFAVSIENRTRQPFKILWEQSQYQDFMYRQHRLIHSGIKPQDRNNIIAPEEVPAGGSIQRDIMPVDAVMYSQEKKGFEIKPLFPLDSDSALSLKGKTFTLFLPVEMDRAIIPDYNFKVEILDAVRE
jgi:hypothetical protein